MDYSLNEILAQYQEAGISNEKLKEQRQRFENRYKNPELTTREISEKGRAYLIRLNQLSSKSNPSLSIAQPKIDFNLAREVCWDIIVEKLGGETANFSKEGNVIEVIPQLIQYFIGDSESNYPLNKGLYLWGDTGSGKTFLFEVMQEMMKQLGLNHKMFKLYNTHDIAEDTLINEKFNPLTYVSGSAVFDDFGQEEPVIKLFNNDIKPMTMIVNRAYDHFKKNNQITHFTGMLPPGLLLEKSIKGIPQIDRRTYERIYEMATIVKLKGKSKRKTPNMNTY